MKLKLFRRAVAFVLALSSFAALPACAQNVGGGTMDATLVSFINRSARTLYLGFSPQPGRPAPFSWSPDCRHVSGQVVLPPGANLAEGQVVLPPGQTCTVSVPVSAGASRFCATENPLPPGKTPNCFAAQQDGLTIIETNFTGQTGCVRPNDVSLMRSCVWYDISVVPEGCTNAKWAADACRESGGASYNVPVQLFCPNETTFSCRGPRADSGARYPLNCGIPPVFPYGVSINVGGAYPANQQAYFFPMSTSGDFKYPADRPQPIDRCPEGGKLFVIFPDGP
ncbi:hypothetical protein ACNHKD_05035 [Methylocystis sp. JAN1]|uniref:hypothetical protein n=1 Tax=Methylocystis sp. JAN1 TaxID=3397211 RepID=UPI003FA1B4DE